MASPASVVYIARHGERIDHVNPAWLETAENPHDPFLTQRGIEQAAALGKHLSTKNLTHIFASPFYRAVQTANEVAKQTGLPIKIENGLGEYLKEAWFEHRPILKDIGELKKDFECIDTSYKSQMFCRFPESKDDVTVRSGCTARLLALKYTGRILLVGHGMTCEFTARGLSNAGLRPYISYCSLQTCHLIEDINSGMYDVDDNVDISFMGESIRPIVKTKWRQ